MQGHKEMLILSGKNSFFFLLFVPDLFLLIPHFKSVSLVITECSPNTAVVKFAQRTL